MGELVLRAAAPVDVPALMALWEVAAENDSRPSDTPVAVERLLALGAGRLDAMVLEGNELGQSLWASSGYAPQPEWRRWVRPVG